MTKLGIFAAGLCLLFATRAAAQAEEPKQNVVRAETPIVAGNVVNAKKRALADAFRQAAEQAFAELLKLGEPMPSPAPPGVAQLKASLANNAQKFVRSYRLIDQQSEGGVLKVMVEIDVDTVLLRREIDRIRGAAAAQAQTAAVKPVARVLFVAGAAPVGGLVAAALGPEGVRAQLDPAGGEPQLLASAARQNAFALFVVARSAGEERVRGTTRVPVKCSLTWRLFPAGAQAAQGPAVARADEEYGFGADETAARNACFDRAAATVARGVAASLRTPVTSAPFVTLQLDIADVGVIPVVLQALKRLGSVTASEVRQVSANQAEIRAFTRIGGPMLLQALGRELGGKLLLVPTRPASDVVAVKVQGPDTPLPSPEEKR
jgi:hypothetical protein